VRSRPLMTGASGRYHAEDDHDLASSAVHANRVFVTHLQVDKVRRPVFAISTIECESASIVRVRGLAPRG